MPVAVICTLVPFAIDDADGVTWIELSVAAVTVSVAVPLTAPCVAVMVLEPAAVPVARPCEPAAFEMLATAPFDEPQVTLAVRFCVLVSEYTPVAVNCWVVPFATEAEPGVT